MDVGHIEKCRRKRPQDVWPIGILADFRYSGNVRSPSKTTVGSVQDQVADQLRRSLMLTKGL